MKTDPEKAGANFSYLFGAAIQMNVSARNPSQAWLECLGLLCLYYQSAFRIF